jgi:hypothetical protein
LPLIFNIERIEGIVLAALGCPIAVRQFRQRSKMVLRSVIVAFVPLAVLLAASSIACIAGYFIVLYLGDEFPFRKVISKTPQLLLVLSIFPAMAWLKLNKQDLGLVVKKLFFKQVLQGFALGLLTLLPIFMIEYGLGIHVLDQSKNWTLGFVVQKIGVSLGLALLISLVEEPLSRGPAFFEKPFRNSLAGTEWIERFHPGVGSLWQFAEPYYLFSFFRLVDGGYILMPA